MAEIPDVQRGTQLFSEGVGRVSPDLAQGMAARLARHGRCPVNSLAQRLPDPLRWCQGHDYTAPSLAREKVCPMLQGGLATISEARLP